jgi:hypothetical protein
MPGQEKIDNSWNEYRRLILQQLENCEEDRAKVWEQIRKDNGARKILKAELVPAIKTLENDTNLRLDRIERRNKLISKALWPIYAGLLTLIGKLIYDWIIGG